VRALQGRGRISQEAELLLSSKFVKPGITNIREVTGSLEFGGSI